MDWLQVVWNSRPRALLRKHGMLVLDAFEVHLTPVARFVIYAMNNDLVVICGRITS
jgi:hypothetical protein